MGILKNKRFLVIIVLLVLASAVAQAEPWSFSVSPLAGVLYGRSDEIVYKRGNSDTVLSELLWDLKPLLYAGIGADFAPLYPFEKNSFSAGMTFKCGLPFQTGIMEDWDYMNDRFQYPTHYSRHNAFARHAFLFDISGGYSWIFKDNFAFKAFAEFSYMRFSWSARDGYYQYPENTADGPQWSPDMEKNYIHGEIIRYTQNWFIVSPGISLTAKLGNNFLLSGGLNYSPFIYCSDRDDHYLRALYFEDIVSGGHFFKGRLSVLYSPFTDLDFSLDFAYSVITGSRGDAYTYAESTNGSVFLGRSYSISGAAYSAFDLALQAKIRLYGRKVKNKIKT